jgi:hypothetical protein
MACSTEILDRRCLIRRWVTDWVMAHTVQPMDEEEELKLESIFLNSFYTSGYWGASFITLIRLWRTPWINSIGVPR